jgi:hypothetical protein
VSVEHAVRTVIILSARYGHDTHGLATCKIPAYVLNAPSSKPYYIPFRALTSGGAKNLLVAGKTMAASFSANSATRLHPEEWSTGPHTLSPAVEFDVIADIRHFLASGVAAGAAAALLMTSADLNSTRDVLLRGMNQLIALLKSPDIAQPLEWDLPTPPPSPPLGPLTWKCEMGRCIGVGNGGGNTTTCGGLCPALGQDEWLANLNFWRAETTAPELLVAKGSTWLKKSTTQCDRFIFVFHSARVESLPMTCVWMCG